MSWLVEEWRLVIKLVCIFLIFGMAIWQIEKERRRTQPPA